MLGNMDLFIAILGVCVFLGFIAAWLSLKWDD
ncbi:protein MgtS [Enterobacter bugandensis]|nr:protein MgtS [Enterobacter bugandensis]MDE7590827.1 protein MgtS [Enterobacter bugandensis]